MSASKLLIISLIVYFDLVGLSAQCDEKITFLASPTQNEKSTGKIELVLEPARSKQYTFRLFKINGEVQLVTEITRFDPKKLSFNNLSAGEYLVKVESEGCKVVLGGIDGIAIAKVKE